MIDKKPNYSAEQETAIIVALDIASLSFETQKEILEELSLDPLFSDKSFKQILAKAQHLSASGIKKSCGEPLYTKKEYLTKRKEKPISKTVLVDEIADYCMVESEVLQSLENANKSALLIVLSSLKAATE